MFIYTYFICLCIFIYLYIFYIYKQSLSGKSKAIVNENGLYDSDVAKQPKRVDWNAHGRTMMTSLYWSVGAVDALE